MDVGAGGFTLDQTKTVGGYEEQICKHTVRKEYHFPEKKTRANVTPLEASTHPGHPIDVVLSNRIPCTELWETFDFESVPLQGEA